MQCWSRQGQARPIPVASTSGCWITTVEGRRIFDLRSAHECINLGFNHPRVLEAMRRQMESVVYVTDDFATEPTAALAAELARLTPGSPRKRVFFSQSGASAVEAAIKGARMFRYAETFGTPPSHTDASLPYPFPYKIISRYRSWHGSSFGASSASGDPRRWFLEPAAAPGFVFAPEAGDYRPYFGEGAEGVERHLQYLDYMVEQEGGNARVAAFLIEPVVGSNGIIPPPAGYLHGLRDLCDRWGLLLIADETMTGLGRTGKFLAIQHDEVEPDIIVMGKALGAYCPLAATIFSEKVSRVFERHIFGHGLSFSGHALSCAAALESLRVLFEERLVERAEELGRYLGERLRAMASRHPSVGDVRGLGLFWTLDLVKDRKKRTPLRRATEKYLPTVMQDISRFLLEERRIYVPSDKFGIWVVPPLVVTRDEIDFIVEGIDASLALADAALA